MKSTVKVIGGAIIITTTIPIKKIEVEAPETKAGDLIHLSPRRKEVLALLLDGKCNKEIAVALFITVRTAKWHVSEILRRFQVKTRLELIQQYTERKKDDASSPPVD